ncbi:MAG TPA: response regulator [Chthoniobacterales bacterium]|jgi:CheY-like chemotaxis protein
MKTEKNDHLQQELRLAQLEIKLLREQLCKSTQGEKQSDADVEPPPSPVAVTRAPESVVIPMKPIETRPVAPTNGRCPRVLYVEDSEPNFRLIESILEDRPGTDLAWAETGQKGIDMARTDLPELVLLDLDLPDLHGSKVLEKLQAQPETANTPVIVISADATPSQIERMLSAGARNYLTKPFEIRRFLCMFDEVFSPA